MRAEEITSDIRKVASGSVESKKNQTAIWLHMTEQEQTCRMFSLICGEQMPMFV